MDITGDKGRISMPKKETSTSSILCARLPTTNVLLTVDSLLKLLRLDTAIDPVHIFDELALVRVVPSNEIVPEDNFLFLRAWSYNDTRRFFCGLNNSAIFLNSNIKEEGFSKQAW